jgi:hypothetical protein
MYEMLAGTDKGFLMKRFLRKEQSVGGDNDADDAARTDTPKKTAAVDNTEHASPTGFIPTKTMDATFKSEPDLSGESSDDSDVTPVE